MRKKSKEQKKAVKLSSYRVRCITSFSVFDKQYIDTYKHVLLLYNIVLRHTRTHMNERKKSLWTKQFLWFFSLLFFRFSPLFFKCHFLTSQKFLQANGSLPNLLLWVFFFCFAFCFVCTAAFFVFRRRRYRFKIDFDGMGGWKLKKHFILLFQYNLSKRFFFFLLVAEEIKRTLKLI